MTYICSNCGSPKTTVRKARPSRKVGGELVEPRKLTDAELKKAHEILERQEEMWR